MIEGQANGSSHSDSSTSIHATRYASVPPAASGSAVRWRGTQLPRHGPGDHAKDASKPARNGGMAGLSEADRRVPAVCRHDSPRRSGQTRRGSP
jgi:hypothetical protein